MAKCKDIAGLKFGRLTAIEIVKTPVIATQWECVCDCGNKTIASLGNLMNGHTKSCGCYSTECILAPKKHGMSYSRFYNIYKTMEGRCNKEYSTSWSRYGAKGIRSEFKSFEEFKELMFESYEKHVAEFGEKNTTLDRIDSTKNYNKENCKWSTYAEQNSNKSNVKLYEVGGKLLSVNAIGRLLNIPRSTLRNRLKENKNRMSIEEVIKRAN